ncbi:hypothetical protein BC833DRAFT_564219 [Globomyces pollinis-pini]|nr:hypothetical protein BC833DRAFT_564219 [Globomyces pollinis-pini]
MEWHFKVLTLLRSISDQSVPQSLKLSSEVHLILRPSLFPHSVIILNLRLIENYQFLHSRIEYDTWNVLGTKNTRFLMTYGYLSKKAATGTLRDFLIMQSEYCFGIKLGLVPAGLKEGLELSKDTIVRFSLFCNSVKLFYKRHSKTIGHLDLTQF